MTPFETVLVSVFVWLYMARLGMRLEWERKKELPASSVFCWLGLWWFGIWFFLPGHLERLGMGVSEDFKRKLIGESRWHKRERRAHKIAQAERELGID